MKKLVATILSIAIVMSLAACSGKQPVPTEQQEQETNVPEIMETEVKLTNPTQTSEVKNLATDFVKCKLEKIREPDKRVERVALELTEFTNTHAEEFYFSQDSDSVFLHTSNSSAILGHIKRSAQYFRYLPSETLTNFFASFAHSLSHIEE